MPNERRMRAAVLGGAASTRTVARQVANSDMELLGILGQERNIPDSPLRTLASELGVPFTGFVDANSDQVLAVLREMNLDYLFVVGISQLVHQQIIDTAAVGCIGFHPTAIPKGRGRSPMAWIVLGEAPAAASLFELAECADAGGILAQVPFEVGPPMDAGDASIVMSEALRGALSDLLPKLARGEWAPRVQDESEATFLGKRTPSDGLIDWNRPAEEVDALIRAAAPPHPGAYCYSRGQKVLILKSGGVVQNPNHYGVVGKVLDSQDGKYQVQCSPGVIAIFDPAHEDRSPANLRVGQLLRTRVEDELNELRKRVELLEQKLEQLTAQK